MIFPVPNLASKHVFYRLWDIYDRSAKLTEMNRLRKLEKESIDVKKVRQREHLCEIVRYAYQHCPFYQKRGTANIQSAGDFNKIPMLTKDDVRRFKSELMSNEYPASSLTRSKTGGSTGVSLELFFDKLCQEKRNGAALWTDRWSGWDFGEPVGALWGNPPVAKTFKEKTRNQCLDRTIYLDTVKLNDESMGDFAAKLVENKINFLFGHAHSLFIFARFIRSKAVEGLDIRGIISTSMMLFPSERREIEQTFGCHVTNRYGCEEVSLIGCECEEHQGMHLNIDHLYIEFIKDNGEPSKAGEEGNIVVTDLLNRGMPLIRYQVGDVGIPSDRICSCGRSLPIMENVTGRTADFLIHEDGSLVAGVSLVERTLTAIPGIEQMQIVQEKNDELHVNIVPDPDYQNESERLLMNEMQGALGKSMKIHVHKNTRLQQESNGKYRFSICKIKTVADA